MTSPAVTGETHCLSPVMPGFMPGIHVFHAWTLKLRRGWPGKPGHDECGFTAGHRLSPTSPAMTKIVRRDDKPGHDRTLFPV